MKTDFKRDGSFCVILYFPKKRNAHGGDGEFGGEGEVDG
jgi:hypothetical protein